MMYYSVVFTNKNHMIISKYHRFLVFGMLFRHYLGF